MNTALNIGLPYGKAVQEGEITERRKTGHFWQQRQKRLDRAEVRDHYRFSIVVWISILTSELHDLSGVDDLVDSYG